jgi:dimethylglycine dehydrogenase
LFYLLGPAMSQTRDFDKLCFWRRSGEDVDVRNVSQEFGCLALTGPRSRDILLELTDAALENVAFPWLDARQVSVAGVPTRALRLSYVGELGWELHMPMADLDTAYAAILEGRCQTRIGQLWSVCREFLADGKRLWCLGS